MKVLVVGGAGHVGGILRPVLEAHHHCVYFDRRPVPEAGSRSIVGDVNDDEAVRRALEGVEAVLYLAMGTDGGNPATCYRINPAFDVNVRGAYRFLYHTLEAGVRRFIYASSMSVYQLGSSRKVDESVPADAWDPYGISKRVGEFICQAAHQAYPDAIILALRLYLPRSQEQWVEHLRRKQEASQEGRPTRDRIGPTGPKDVQELFLAALRCDKPGAHILQTTGDVKEELYPHGRVFELLGWKPQGH